MQSPLGRYWRRLWYPCAYQHLSGKVQPDNQQGLEFVRKQIKHWVQQDLRATLRMGNVLTGALYVDLQHVENASGLASRFIRLWFYSKRLRWVHADHTKVDALLNKLNQIPLDTVVEDVQQVLATMTATTNLLAQTSDNINAKISNLICSFKSTSSDR